MTSEKIKVCDYHGRDNEPCYGKIDEYFEDGKWITFCEGHKGVYNGGWYVPKDPIRRLIFSQQNQRIRELEAEIEYLKRNSDTLRKALLLQDIKVEIELPQERLDILDYI